MLLLETLAEQKIRSAMETGEFDNLAGAGKPLVLDDDNHIPAALRVSYRILKNSGYLPAEMTLLREIQQVETLLLCVSERDEKSQLMTRLSLLKSKMTTSKKHLL